MPELIEVEAYRSLAEEVVGRRIRAVRVDPLAVGDLGPSGFRAAAVGHRVSAARRTGKVLFLETDGPTIALRFGMTGRLLVDGQAAIDRLEYSSGRDESAWDRTVLEFAPGSLVVRDPRRLGRVALDIDEDLLGPDATRITTSDLAWALEGSRTALKARLLDQRRVAGLGNLLVDETCWRAGIDPARPAGSLERAGVRRLAANIRSTVATLTRRGGSHTGDLQEHRRPGGVCPRDGHPLDRRTVGGRTTYSCPAHQN